MIVTQLTGGQGNQMFQYAFGSYLAKKHNTNFKIDTSILLNHIPCDLTPYNYDLGIFNIRGTIATEKDIPLYTKKYNVKSLFHRIIHLLYLRLKGLKYEREWKFGFDQKYLMLPNNTYLDGYWQSEKFFKKIEPDIRKEFTFNFEIKGLAAEMANKIKSSNAVCVHIRRGDYLRYSAQYSVVGQEYISNGVKIITDKVNTPNLFVFSNDIAWCKDHLKFDHPHTFIDSENAGKNDKEHFALMSFCKHFVIANSTFSWWAAWLSENKNKIVVAPKKWLNDPKINVENIYPEDWIKI
jgi:hypothetical protein